jgi:hypothetical protein
VCAENNARAFARATRMARETAHAAVRVAGAIALACALALPAPASASPDAAKSTEEKAIGAFLSYCLPAVGGAADVARVAEKRKLRPVPKSEQAAYLEDVPGQVFELPDVGLGVVLTAADTPACSVMLEKVDARAFIEQTTYWLSNDQSAFHLAKNKTKVNGDIEREYRADVDGKTVVVRVLLRLKPVPNAPQATLTAGRE